MGDNPIAWDAMKEHRKEEKQRKYIAEAKKIADKIVTENLTKLPLQADFPMGKENSEWDNIIEKNLRETLWQHERLMRCATREHYDALGAIGRA